jgi:hypothetical protein
MPVNKLEKAYKNLVKTRRLLKNYFPTKDKFREFIKISADLKEEDWSVA